MGSAMSTSPCGSHLQAFTGRGLGGRVRMPATASMAIMPFR